MIKEYSLIKNGKVVNRIVADPDFIDSISKDYDLITDDDSASIGAAWDGDVFTPPQPPVPVETLEAKLDALTKKVEALVTATKEEAVK